MCRLLAAIADQPFAPAGHLQALADIARHSHEYQGHGWGCAWLTDDGWTLHHSIRPIWEDTLPSMPATSVLIAHARSAFRNEGIAAENNMPFRADQQVFAFNGELHGVRVRAPGRIGAERIFNFVRRFDDGDLGAALETGVHMLAERTRYVRAMNIVLAEPQRLHVSTLHNEDPEYFTLHTGEQDGVRVVCSEPYANGINWSPIANNTVRTFACS